MYSISTVSPKGWVVIPGELRNRYKLSRGTKVAFVDYGGILALVPVPNDPITAGLGMLKGYPLTKELLSSRKEDATREEFRPR